MVMIEAETMVWVWTDEKVAELKRLFHEGKSSNQIARLIGCGTRNQVIGKINRLQLGTFKHQRPVPAPKAVEPPRSRVSAVHRPTGSGMQQDRADKHIPRPVVVEEPVDATRCFDGANRATIGILDLSLSTCRWPLEVPDEGTRYCGDSVEAGVYCHRHARMSYANAAQVAARTKAWHEARKGKQLAARRSA